MQPNTLNHFKTTMEVVLFFHKPTPDDHYINHAVAAVDGPFSHVEIAFPSYSGNKTAQSDSTKILFGSSIFQGGSCFFFAVFDKFFFDFCVNRNGFF